VVDALSVEPPSNVAITAGVTESAVRHFRRPSRIELRGQDAELAALVANVPGAIYRCALDADWTMSVISDEIERISGYPASHFIDNRSRTLPASSTPTTKPRSSARCGGRPAKTRPTRSSIGS
jgi:hypothetical protein